MQLFLKSVMALPWSGHTGDWYTEVFSIDVIDLCKMNWLLGCWTRSGELKMCHAHKPQHGWALASRIFGFYHLIDHVEDNAGFCISLSSYWKWAKLKYYMVCSRKDIHLHENWTELNVIHKSVICKSGDCRAWALAYESVITISFAVFCAKHVYRISQNIL